jgi:fumarate hydratase class II
MARSSRPTRSGSRRVETNGALGLLDQHRDRAIVRAAPEAIANRADKPSGDELGCRKPVRQNDHVDMSPSSNDSFPTAMHIAAGLCIAHDLAPALSERHRARRAKEKAFAKIVKIGRACTRNATPLTRGLELSNYAAQLARGTKRLELAVTELIPPKKEPGSSIVSALVYCMMHSIQRLADSVCSYAEHPVNETLRDPIDRSLIKVTAPAPKIGCDNAAKMTKSTCARGTMLKETAVPHGFLSPS